MSTMGCNLGIFFPAVSHKDALGGVMIENEILPFESNVVENRTLDAIGCTETLCGVYDAFAAAAATGLLGSLSCSYGFSDRSLRQIQSGNYYLTGDSLSLSVFVSIIFAALGKSPARPIAVTGAIHAEDGHYVCSPVAMLDRKIRLIHQASFRRVYLPAQNAKDCPTQLKDYLELVPLPRDLRSLVDIIAHKEELA